MSELLFQKAEQHIEANYDKVIADLKTLVAIPSPTGNEGKRAEEIKNRLEAMGAKGVIIDEALNVIYPYHADNRSELICFMAHTDTVFPDLDPIPHIDDGEKIFALGIGDNTASCTGMLEMINFLIKNDVKPKNGFLFVFDSNEEGLGNLKGAIEIMKNYKSRIKEVVAVDGSSPGYYINEAVGSKRYRVTVKTEGGHSYGAYGNRNAIHYMASLINTLYAMKVPPLGKTTYNVGLIEGGTSVNTIAQSCNMMYEYRSNSKEALEIMDKMFENVISGYQAMGIEVVVELLGDRPCGGEVDNAELEARVQAVGKAMGYDEIIAGAGSTDCNIPLSQGIPSVCIPIYKGGKAHTREEYMYKDSMKDGFKFFAKFILSYC